MPSQTYWPQYYTTTATTTNYISNYDHAYLTTGSLTTTLYPTNQIWQQWVNQSYTVGTQATWLQWMDQSSSPSSILTYREPTPEEIAHHRAENEERAKHQTVARARARILLGEFLDAEQRAELERHGRFHVTGSRGRRYCIRAEGQTGNVDLLKPDGNVQAKLCCHPGAFLPEGDAWLMQMIEIRHDEDHFLRTANVLRGQLPALVR